MEILFCIPGGGTSSLMYMGWQKLLKDEFTIIPLEIPGRGRLREMERASSLEEIAEGMARQVCEQANGRSYGIFGYCYGGILAYEICRILGLNAKAAARGGILHDLFLYDWHTHAKRTGEHFHGLTHPKVALLNASRYFDLTPLEKDIIRKHMWPLTLMPPRYPESFLITLTDKYSGAREVAEYYAGKVNPGRLKLPFGYRGIQLLARKWVRDAKREGVLEEDTPSDKQS